MNQLLWCHAICVFPRCLGPRRPSRNRPGKTKEPTKEGEPITLTVTSKGEPDRRRVFEVDPKSKLVERMIEFRRRGDRWEQASQIDYLEYNEEFDPKVFGG